MGFGEVATQAILFIAVLSIATGLVVTVKSYTDQTASSQSELSEAYNNKLKTIINIDVVHYDTVTDELYIYAKNLGTTKMLPEKIDIYVDSIRIPRNDTNRTATIEVDTDSLDVGVWNIREELKIVVHNIILDESKTHEVMLITPYEVRDKYEFSI